MLHVGMNISEKATLAAEVFRLLKPGGRFGIYDLMRAGDGEWRAIPNSLTALGSSSLYTTVEDLARWLMNFHDTRVGGEAIIQRMKTRGVLNDDSQISYAFGVTIGEICNTNI